jgi:hypothetical protein
MAFYWLKTTGGGGDGDPSFLLARRRRPWLFTGTSLGVVFTAVLLFTGREFGLLLAQGSDLGFLLAQASRCSFYCHAAFTGRPCVSSEDFRQFFLPLWFLLLPPTMPHGPIT